MSLPTTITHRKKKVQHSITKESIESTTAVQTSTTSSYDGERFQIFLGGSCNPTTWRQTIAIPYLELNGISYYNPQVDDWTPEVVDIEKRAKRNAEWLLFVIDEQTRSTVSLVESAFLAGAGKPLILVINPFENTIDQITIQSDTQQMSNIVETHEETTTTSTTRHASSSLHLQSTSSSRSSSSSKTMTSSSSNFAIGKFRVNGELIGLSEFQELRQARYILESLVLSRAIPIFPDLPQALRYVSDSLEAARQLILDPDKISPITSDVGIKSSSVAYTDRASAIKPSKIDSQPDTIRDIYLSLDDNDIESIKSSIVPILQERGLTFDCKPVSCVTRLSTVQNAPITSREAISELSNTHRYPTIESESETKIAHNPRLALEKELSAIKRSRVILFVISNKCRGLSIMVLASHFMALFRHNVVLCIQYLDEPSCINGEALSKSAIADYNRGRVYLGDYAVETQVPVFGTIREAVDCCSQKCGYDGESNTIK